MPLTEERRKQLDGIVGQMVQNGESDENINFVVGDFKSKYEGEQQAAPQSQKKSVGGFIKNVGSSTVNLAKGVGNAVIHPITTARAVGDLPVGLVEKAIPGQQGSEKTLDALLQLYKQRYGGVQNVQDTAYNDPAGLAADAAALLSGGGGALSKVGEVSKAGNIARAGEIAANIGNKVDPLQALLKGTGKVAVGAKNLGASGAAELAGMTTGVGGKAVRTAFEGGKDFTDALRGTTTPEQVVQNAKSAVGSIKDQRRAAYLQGIEKAIGGNPTIDLLPAQQQFRDLLDKFNIKITNKGLNFDRSVISDSADATKIEKLFKDLKGWNDTSLQGVDTLKRRIDNLVTPSLSREAQKLILGTKDAVRQELNKIPGYSEATAAYAQHSDLINQIEKSLSLGDKATLDTSLRKLTSVLRQNFELRDALVGELKAASGKDIRGQIAGLNMSELSPRGIMRPLVGGTTAAGIGGVAVHIISPQLLLGLASASPRIVGELANALGMSSRALQNLLSPIKKMTGKAIGNAAVNRILEQSSPVSQNLPTP